MSSMMKEIVLSLFLIIQVTLTATEGQFFDSFSSPSFFNDDIPSETLHFFGPPSDAFWRQFWDAFNYKGPLQENPFYQPTVQPHLTPLERPIIRPVTRPVTVPYFSNSGFDESYPSEEYFIPRRETTKPVIQKVTIDHQGDYNRYRDYFYRRYGTNFVD